VSASQRWGALRGAIFTMAPLMRSNRWRTVLVIALTIAGALSGPVIALGLRSLTNAALSGHAATAAVAGALTGVMVSAQLTMGHFAHNVHGELSDRARIAIDAELIELVQDATELAACERSDFADELSLLRNEISQLTFVTQGILETAAIGLQIVLTVVLLVQVQPLLLLLPLFAIAPLLAGKYAQRIEERAQQVTAEPIRQVRSLLTMATQPGPAREIRLFGLADELCARQGTTFTGVARVLGRAELSAAAVRSVGQLMFAAGYVGALLIAVHSAIAGHQGAGAVVLVIVLAGQVSSAVAQMLGLAAQIQSSARIARRWSWLAGAYGTAVGTATHNQEDLEPTPPSLRTGIEMRGVTFSYPGARASALTSIDLTLPAGAVVAVIGENGAGKTTLVKLLCGLYEPQAGAILVDGVPLAAMGARPWRARVTAAFQDFCHLEFTVRETIGVGDLPHIGSPAAVRSAADRAGAGDLIEQLPAGLETPLGSSHVSGVELSGGQWQRLGLSRALMRESPLLVVLDEPTSSLDAAAEHVLFTRYATYAKATGARAGTITLLITHRFSTVAMADQILVMKEGHVSERGGHAELLARNGTYAEMYRLQAAAYR
jgi:ATP-binding cassette, subfamily B, bacterial